MYTARITPDTKNSRRSAALRIRERNSYLQILLKLVWVNTGSSRLLDYQYVHHTYILVYTRYPETHHKRWYGVGKTRINICKGYLSVSLAFYIGLAGFILTSFRTTISNRAVSFIHICPLFGWDRKYFQFIHLHIKGLKWVKIEIILFFKQAKWVERLGLNTKYLQLVHIQYRLIFLFSVLTF